MISTEIKPPAFWGSGEMSARIRAYNWSATPLGAPETWPQSLQASVSILLNSQFPMFIWWGQELITIYNDAYRAIAGEKHPSLLGKSGREGWTEIWSDLDPLVEKVFNGSSTWSEDQVLYLNRHGYVEETYFTFSYSPIMDVTGTVSGLFCACIETTEKVLAARKIRESERNLRATILQSPVAMCILKGPSFVLEIANERMFELWGRGADALMHLPIFEGLPEARNQGLEELLYHVYVTGETFTASERPIQLPRANGAETVYINFVYEPFREGDGTISGIIAVAIDVTEQVMARKKVEESERKLQAVIEATPECIKIVSADGTLQFMNASGLQMIEGEPSLFSKACVFDVIAPEYRAEWVQNHKRVCAGESLNWEYEVIGLKGTRRRMETHAVPLPGKNGTAQLAVTRDITQRKKAEEALRQSEARNRLAIESARIGTFEINVVQQTIVHSPRAAEIIGRDPAKSWPYETFINSLHPDDLPVRKKAHDKASRTGELMYEARVILPDQSIRWIRLNGVLIDQENDPLLIGTMLDITEEKRAAELLEKRIQERTNELTIANEQLKQFAYAASHDLQEPLRKISFFSDRLISSLGTNVSDESKNIANRIQSTTGRMRTLIDDLLNYSNTSMGTVSFEDVDLNSLVKEVLDDMEATIIEKGAVIDLQELPYVKGDSRQLKQLFLNLLSNALKYHKVDEPPHVQLQCKLVKGWAYQDKISSEQSKLEYYQIEVKDNGIGFLQEDEAKIFGLFQRLHGKSEYEGTGVGLAIVKKVVENHNGLIWADSEPGAGAVFKVLLPAEKQ